MPRPPWHLCVVALCLGCDAGQAAQTAAPAPTEAPSAPETSDEAVARKAAAQTALDRDFPLHGLVTGVQLQVRDAADPEAQAIAFVRIGSRLRLAPVAEKTATCATGWHPVSPRGFVCAGQGVEVAQAPPASTLALAPPARDAGLPYRYYFIKELRVPEYHRLPTRADQRRAAELLARYFELKEKKPERAEALLRGALGEREPPRPKVIRRFLDRGFFVAGAGVEKREGRRFVRTVRGAYVQEAKLLPRTGSDFVGVALGTEPDGAPTLPLAWATRDARPFEVKPREDGSLRMVADPETPPYPRLSRVPWAEETHVGDVLLHRLQDGKYLKHWFLAVAKAVKRPRGVPANSPWIHVDLSQQTLVAYAGDRPVYATLVSSGLPEHDTPTGLFSIREKHVADSMSGIGPEVSEDDRYSIEDVPWTQYFEGSIALHGAFWHERFGLQRSHGCVNLAPRDAHFLFDHTWPALPEGFHAIFPERAELPASKVWVTP